MYTQTDLDSIKSNILNEYKRVKKDKVSVELYELLLEEQYGDLPHSEVTELVVSRSLYGSKLLNFGRRVGATSTLAIEIVFSMLKTENKNIVVITKSMDELKHLKYKVKSLILQLIKSDVNSPQSLLRTEFNTVRFLTENQIKNHYALRGISIDALFIDGANRFDVDAFKDVGYRLYTDNERTVNVVVTTNAEPMKHAYLFRGKPYSYFKIPSIVGFGSVDHYNKYAHAYVYTYDIQRDSELNLGVSLNDFKD